MKLELKEFEEKMKKSVAGLESEYATISAGRASASVLDRVQVEYFGSNMPINQVAEIKMADPRTLVISPWDASCLKNIEKAILASDLGINPQNDGKVIRLAFPQPTEERRKELAKKAEKLTGGGKALCACRTAWLWRFCKCAGKQKSRPLPGCWRPPGCCLGMWNCFFR